MKILVFFATLLFVVSSWSKPVSGEIFYKKKSGEVARRVVTLEVPPRGKGEVILSGNNFEWRTTDFWTIKEKAQVVFVAVFKTEFMGMKSMIAIEGTYLNGSNEIIYNGNFFKKDGHSSVNNDISSFEYGGGFTFSHITKP